MTSYALSWLQNISVKISVNISVNILTNYRENDEINIRQLKFNIIWLVCKQNCFSKYSIGNINEYNSEIIYWTSVICFRLFWQFISGPLPLIYLLKLSRPVKLLDGDQTGYPCKRRNFTRLVVHCLSNGLASVITAIHDIVSWLCETSTVKKTWWGGI